MLKSYYLYWCLLWGIGAICPYQVIGQHQTHKVSLSYYLPQDVTYNPDVPTPKDILGYEVGDWHVSHDQLLTYMRAIARASSRVTIHEHGFSYEHRPIVYLTFTSEDNHSNLAFLKAQHLQLV